MFVFLGEGGMMSKKLRCMRIIVFFDLPIETSLDRRVYRKFRKYLIVNGFYMMQKSVYCKMVLNQGNAIACRQQLKLNRPANGLVQVLTITENQFVKMEYITGFSCSDVLSDTKPTVIL